MTTPTTSITLSGPPSNADRTNSQVLFVLNHVLTFMAGSDPELTIKLTRNDGGLTFVDLAVPSLEPDSTPETPAS